MIKVVRFLIVKAEPKIKNKFNIGEKMKENLKLLNAIRTKGLNQKDFARLVGDNDCMISRVVRGWMNLDDKRKLKYAKVLNCKVDELFGE